MSKREAIVQLSSGKKVTELTFYLPCCEKI